MDQPARSVKSIFHRGLSGDLRDRFEQANQHGRRFLQTYQTLLNQDDWYDSPREFSWHAGN